MGEYLAKLAAAHNNLVINAEDGSVWANYLLRGAQMIPSSPGSIASAQAANEELFNACSRMPTRDIYLAGIKSRVNPEETANRIVQGVTKISGQSHPELLDRVNRVVQEMKYGRYKEYRRNYFMSVKIPTGLTSQAQALIKSGKVDVLSKVNWSEWAEYQEQFVELIPSVFARNRDELMARPEHLTWMHERMRLRGLDVPMMPSGGTQRFNPRSFSSVMINKVADSEPVIDAFIKETGEGSTPQVDKGRLRQYRRNYRAALMGGMVAVYSPEERTPSLPDGPVSRQTLLAVTGYPIQSKVTLNTFTSLVDRDASLDADFALRMHFDQDDISVEQHRAFTRAIGAESTSNSKDSHDQARYSDQAHERALLAQQVDAESAPRSMAVTALFALAHPKAETLRQFRTEYVSTLENKGFSVLAPVGGQFDLLRQMMPCVSTSNLVNDLKGGTTVRKFAACMPIRRTEAGDAVGIPYAINRENALGQMILRDFLGSTDKGSGSLAITGAQGSGKSMELKAIIDWLAAMQRPCNIFDPSAAREFLVYARALMKCQPVEVVRPAMSFDPLKVFADDPDMAQEVMIEVWQILTGWAADSPQMLLLSDLVQPGMRRSKDIGSMRDLMRVLDESGAIRTRAGAAELSRAFSFWSGQRAYNQALFDPINDSGQVIKQLPAFRRESDDTSVVFVTHGLPVHRGPLTENTPPKARFSVAMHSLMARLTQADFRRITGLCAMVGDEVAFWEGSDAVQQMIGDLDRTGRKDANIAVFAGQLPKHMASGAFDLIRCKTALRQETSDNAKSALQWVEMPPLESLVTRMLTDTSPPDPEDNNRPKRGREGEGWYNDGFGNVVRVQCIPPLNPEVMRMADTTSSRRIHVEDEDDRDAVVAGR
ncbi:ATP-binding protein [Gordonia malaquae]|uniref:ATP-binding protein n=1 Tax=Gordonia malaquae TaxID=410332 RepID=UPI0030179F7B